MIETKDIENVDGDSVKVVGKASALTLSKKSTPGDGSFSRGRKGGGGGFSIS